MGSGPPVDYQVHENNCDYFMNDPIMQSIKQTSTNFVLGYLIIQKSF